MSYLPRPFVLLEANYRQLLDSRPRVAILPWGATEAHNYHLPCGTDVIQASELAIAAADLASQQGAQVVVLPTIPFGNNAQQLDQVATIHFSTTTALAILRDVARSLTKQGIDRLVILNAHGGNEFKPLVRDVQLDYDLTMVVVNFWTVAPDVRAEIFEAAGDHADEMETSLMLYLCPKWVAMEQAGSGQRVPFALKSIQEVGAWTPRPWSRSHPDTGSGDPSAATAEKGELFFKAVVDNIVRLLVEFSAANKEDLPYV